MTADWLEVGATTILIVAFGALFGLAGEAVYRLWQWRRRRP